MTPDDHTISETILDVGHGQQLYVQEWGNAKAKTAVIFLHGGPGSGCSNGHRGLFDPLRQRVLFFDQRGCGKSLPKGELEHNTTDNLIQDITKLADHFGLTDFVLCGGSWGSCLALAYGLKHPQRVKAMVLRGIFTGTQTEIDYLDKGGFRPFFPDVWDRYLAATPPAHRHDPTAYHYQQVVGSDPQAARVSACAYNNLEGALLSLDDRFTPQQPDDPTYDPTGATIEMHYLAHRCFLPERHILANATKLTMPIWLVQGRYDMVCPPQTAYELAARLPQGHLIYTISGHRGEHEAWSVMRTILLQMSEH